MSTPPPGLVITHTSDREKNEIFRWIRTFLKWNTVRFGEVTDEINNHSSGAPVDAQYLTLALNSTLTQERRFDPSADDFLATDGGANADYDLSIKRLKYNNYMMQDWVNINAGSGRPDDFLAAQAGGVGTTTTIADIAGHPGIFQFTNTANGTMCLNSSLAGGNPGPHYPAADPVSFTTWFKTPDVLSDANNRYFFRIGMGTNLTANEAGNKRWYGLSYIDTVNSGKWYGATRSTLGTTDTAAVNGNVTVLAATWYRATLSFAAGGNLSIVITDGTNSETINITTDKPDLSAGAYFHIGITRTVTTASAARIWAWDASELWTILTTPRI